MALIVGVRFKTVGKVYYFDPDGLDLPLGEKVIVETTRGIECGEVALEPRELEGEEFAHPLKKVMRVATKADLQQVEENLERQKKAFAIAQEKIEKHGLDMTLIDVEYTFDGNKILFYFTAEGRIDFRELVKDMASVFRTRIELRQIGVRDEAKLLGGLGVCGRPFCCATFLDEFQPVSIKMAKEQGLSLNPTKISGTCGRLMCCLKYEQEAYEDLMKTTPKAGSLVETPEGRGIVTDVNLLTGRLSVRLDQFPDAAPGVFHRDDVTLLRGSRGGGGRPFREPRGERQEAGQDREGEVLSSGFVAEEATKSGATEGGARPKAARPGRGRPRPPRTEGNGTAPDAASRPARNSGQRNAGEAGAGAQEPGAAGEAKPRSTRPYRGRKPYHPRGEGKKPQGE
ncbi:MAG: hypothetical protein HFJ86_03530 [Oscillospiraceae bacterium]|jgi:cell fate regulator YaaT (PSP1 superfamily)|nr:hypothetical protein [Oscillospiraceae bacterium]